MKNYRVWNRDTNEWVHAILAKKSNGVCVYKFDPDLITPICEGLLENVDVEFASGITDIKGQQIFEGDFIQYKSYEGKEYIMPCAELHFFHHWQETEDNQTVRVIGNRHDNPEIKCGLVE